MSAVELESKEQQGESRKQRFPNGSLLLVILGCAFLVILLRRAWLCDDAFITFRTVDNLVNGYRLTWNVMERVQAYTHPLWMMVISLFYFVTREIYFTPILVSAVFSLAALYVLSRWISVSASGAAFAVFTLILSKAYMDYSTSGLENPLSHLLAAVFFALFLRDPRSAKQIFFLSLTASLGILNRMDLALVFAPAMAAVLLRNRNGKAVKALLLGQIPFLVWEIFSTFYYGFPFPNTAYAKLNTGISAGAYTGQGLLYLLNSLQHDPITLLIITAGTVIGLGSRKRFSLCVSVGALLYLVYIVRIGGDFMSGRFLTVPLLLAVINLARIEFTRLPQASLAGTYALCLFLALNVDNPTLRIMDNAPVDSGPVHVGENGILDERLLYFGGTGLLNTSRDQSMPTFYWGRDGEIARNELHPVVDRSGIGLFAFYAGPKVYVIDRLALADPLLARLPAQRKVEWRVGHMDRAIPKGYVQTLTLQRNSLDDPGLAALYDKLTIITRGGLFSGQRLLEIWKMNTGQYDHLVDQDAWRYPGLLRLSADDLQKDTPDGTVCEPGGASQLMTDSGAEVTFHQPQRELWLQISLNHDQRFELRFFSDSMETGRVTLPTLRLAEPGGLSARMVQVPAQAAEKGYTRLRVFPLSGSAPYCLGNIHLVATAG